VTIVPEEILTAAKTLAGDRIIPALLTPQKLATNGDLNGMGHTSSCPTALRNFTRSPPIPC